MFRFENRAIYSSFVVIGCGGTGSRLIPPLLQLIKNTSRPWNPMGLVENPKVYFIDDDIVEQKNLKRQNFIEQDVGRNKAVVMAERYSRGFGIEITPITARLTSDYLRNQPSVPSDPDSPSWGTLLPANLANVGQFTLANSMVFLCVDSADARRNIIRQIFTEERRLSDSGIPFSPSMIIDAGNEDDFGQVRYFNTVEVYGDILSSYTAPARKDHFSQYCRETIPKLHPHVHPVHFMPYPSVTYAEMGNTVEDRSCADLDQTLAINTMMATHMLGITQNLLFFKPMTYNVLRLSLQGGNATEYLTPQKFLAEVCGKSSTMNPYVARNDFDVSMEYQNAAMETFKAMGLKVVRDRERYPMIQANEVCCLVPVGLPPEKTAAEKKAAELMEKLKREREEAEAKARAAQQARQSAPDTQTAEAAEEHSAERTGQTAAPANPPPLTPIPRRRRARVDAAPPAPPVENPPPLMPIPNPVPPDGQARSAE